MLGGLVGKGATKSLTRGSEGETCLKAKRE
jgi:hypothetical protein